MIEFMPIEHLPRKFVVTSVRALSSSFWSQIVIEATKNKTEKHIAFTYNQINKLVAIFVKVEDEQQKNRCPKSPIVLLWKHLERQQQ